MSIRFVALVAAACFCLAPVASAQEPTASEGDRQTEDVQRTRGGVNQQFERNSPPVGAALPDLKAYDADGKEVRLGTLKGRYTVLVFGCLT